MKKIEKPEDFIGETFNNGNLEIVSIYSRVNKTVVYKVTCKICSQDPELFPEGYFLSTKGNLEKGKLPCGCSKTPKWKEYHHIVRLNRAVKNKSFVVHGFAEEFHGQKTRVNCECLIDGYKWTPTISSIVNGNRGCQKCAGKYKPTEQEAFNECEKICLENNYKAVSFPNGYKNKYSKFKYICLFHGEQIVVYEKWVKEGTRCPGCYCGGYNPNKHGAFYVVKWTHENHLFLKFGITNRDVNVRIKEQSDVTNYKPEFLFVANFNDGSIPLNIESRIKSSNLNRNIISKELFADGFTETINIEDLHILEDLIVDSLTIKEV